MGKRTGEVSDCRMVGGKKKGPQTVFGDLNDVRILALLHVHDKVKIKLPNPFPVCKVN